MIYAVTVSASVQAPVRARHGRGGARLGEYGSHFEAAIGVPTSASGHMQKRARHGRGGARMGEYGGHFEAPVSK